MCALWMLYLPTGALARAMVEKPRGTSFLETAREVFGADVDVNLTQSLLGYCDMVVEPSGLVKVQMLSGANLGHPLRRLAEGTKTVPPTVALTRNYLARDESGELLPSWFRG